MPRSAPKSKKDPEPAPGLVIPRQDWTRFLATFSRAHRDWLVRLQTHDRVTEEDVTSTETPLDSIDYDLEDEKNPRINVIVRLDNKVIKHILFLPSQMTLRSSGNRGEKCLSVKTVNTETSVFLRPPHV